MRRAPEAACWLPLGCWSNNSANSHPSLGALNRRILRACLMPQCSYRLINPAINDALRIVTGCLHPTPADNLPSLAGIQPAELRRIGATLSFSTPCHEAWTFAPLSAHPPIECKRTAPQIETPIRTRHTTSHQFI